MIENEVETPANVPLRNSSRFKPTLIRALLVLGAAACGAVLIMNLTGGIDRCDKPEDAQTDLAEAAENDLQRRHFRPLSGELEALLNCTDYEAVPTQTHSLLRGSAPDFSLKDVDGKEWQMSQHLGDGPIVLVFYYGYHCDHCVSQLFGLHKDIEKFRELGATVAAISGDPPELTRRRFKKYGAFDFPVLSDTGNTVAKLYGTHVPDPKGKDDGDLMHGTFIISREGRIVWANRGDEPFTENRTLLIQLHRLEPPSKERKQ